MNKFIQVFLVTLILAGCANLPSFLVTPTVPLPSETPTPFISETPIPTQNLFATTTPTPLTFTPTVTALGAELFTPTSTETSLPTHFPTPDIPSDPSSSGYFTPESTGFLTILLSSNTLYWDEGPCTPREVKVSAFVEDQLNTHHVFLFTRLREKKNTLNVTRWNAGALMSQAENGSFNYELHTFNLRRYYYFVNGWIEYQLVAVNEDNEVIGRTPVYNQNLSLVRCKLVP